MPPNTTLPALAERLVVDSTCLRTAYVVLVSFLVNTIMNVVLAAMAGRVVLKRVGELGLAQVRDALFKPRERSGIVAR